MIALSFAVMFRRSAILSLGLILFSTLCLKAQNNYRTALGLRLNGGAGISVRHFLNSKGALEGILYTRWRGTNITGLYTVNTAVFDEPGFNFFIGGGGHIGFWDRSTHPWWRDEDFDGRTTVIGVDGQLGLEYTFDEIPLNLSVDWKPAINLVGVQNFWGSDIALSVRYTFK